LPSLVGELAGLLAGIVGTPLQDGQVLGDPGLGLPDYGVTLGLGSGDVLLGLGNAPVGVAQLDYQRLPLAADLLQLLFLDR
jgi:hypothetical protein